MKNKLTTVPMILKLFNDVIIKNNSDNYIYNCWTAFINIHYSYLIYNNFHKKIK